MFGSFKKAAKKEPEKKIHPELGELEDIGFWLGRSECKMFGKLFELKLFLFVDEDIKTDIAAQLESYRYYRENMEEINRLALKELSDVYELDNETDLEKGFQPTTLILFPNGDCGLSFRDMTEIRGSSAAQMVVEILPKIKFVGSEDDYC